ncbi:hypothetical protein LWI29_002443 [Acer saccharum]|uniref:RNase H type-1 domain-containing protein n=1 Tax=Acer saccharum TaxID=4024 RepID=A0AA39RHP1_ACESA|nr:hypothetical protein LWI29_002443 [Acer saccharum]
MILAKKVSLSGNLTGMLPCIITWCLWNRRCKARMEGLKASTEQVWRSVKTWLKILATELKVHKKLTAQDTHLLNDLNLEPPSVAVQKCMFFRGCRGGGILRDANGYFKGAFTSHYGVGSNNRAELKALFDGIRLCKRLSYFIVIIESDSKIVVDRFRVGKCTLWYLWDFWDECIKEMQGTNVRIVHQFRERNQAADFLAKLGERGSNVIYEEFQELPRLLYGIVRIDRSGLLAIRH